MKRVSVFLYGVASYVIFFASFLYAIGFIGNLWVPKTMDSGPVMPFWSALGINVLLLGLFAVQHSLMARPFFKRWFTRFIPEPAERSTYVLLSSLCLIVLFYYWQPMGGVVWSIENTVGQAIMYSFYAFGWVLLLVATFLINHFDLFGLRQVWLYLNKKEYTHLEFDTPWLYKYVRHPLYVGWFVIFWATPQMTITHLLFALATSAYIIIAVFLEEKDLVDHHGQKYIDYQAQVPKYIPRLSKSPTAVAEATSK